MELQIVTLIIEGLVGAAITYLGWKFKKIREAEEEIKLRERNFEELELLNTSLIIIRECHHYIERGFAPIYAKNTITEIYRKYHFLGGNGGIEELYHELMRLPYEKKVNFEK